MGEAPLSGDSLNPALEDARFCPRCAAPATVDFPRSITCAACGYGAFFNPKPVACVIPRDQRGRIILVRRAFDPGKGLWSMPGGFVDLGETVEDAARREAVEELGIEVELRELVGVYSRAEDRVVTIVFEGRAEGTPSALDEVMEVRAFAPQELPWTELAFPSDQQALRRLTGAG